MQDALYIEISAVGIILLSVILVTQTQTIGSSAAQRRFNSLIYATIAMLVVDAGCWLIDGQLFRFARALNIILETLYYTLHILLPYLWALYVEGALSTDMKAARRRIGIATTLLVLFILALAVNVRYGFVFTVDAKNVYHREWGVYVYVSLSYAYLLYATIRSLLKAKGAAWADDRRRYYTMAFFAVLPSAGGVLQLLFYGLSLNWILASVSILLVYIDSQNRQISTDPLTGLNNRRELSKFLLREMREHDPARSGVLLLIMMDVDGFKQINDTCGHYYGDLTLINVANILKASCKNTAAFLARFGGDEFCIVLPAEKTAEADELITRIQANLSAWNDSSRDSKPIGLSVGYAAWDMQNDETFESFVNRADQKMYEVKNAKKFF